MPWSWSKELEFQIVLKNGSTIAITSSLSVLHVGDTATHVGDIPTSCFIWRTICVNSTHIKISILLFKIDAGAIAEKYLSYQIVKTCPTDDVFCQTLTMWHNFCCGVLGF